MWPLGESHTHMGRGPTNCLPQSFHLPPTHPHHPLTHATTTTTTAMPPAPTRPPPASLPTKVKRRLVGHKAPIYTVRFNGK